MAAQVLTKLWMEVAPPALRNRPKPVHRLRGLGVSLALATAAVFQCVKVHLRLAQPGRLGCCLCGWKEVRTGWGWHLCCGGGCDGPLRFTRVPIYEFRFRKRRGGISRCGREKVWRCIGGWGT